MSKKQFNYSKQFNKPEQEPVVKYSIEEPVQEPTVETQPEVKPETPQAAPKMGVVINCDRLNVRKGPSKQTNPASTISKGTIVEIVEELPDWYKITAANGNIKGYCMSEFIELR